MGKKHKYYGRNSHVNKRDTCNAGWLPAKADNRCYRKCKPGKIRRYSACNPNRGFCAPSKSIARKSCKRRE